MVNKNIPIKKYDVFMLSYNLYLPEKLLRMVYE